ncbi:MAG: hypothetical protein ACI376_03160 [Candidatus Bruticola sp.]
MPNLHFHKRRGPVYHPSEHPNVKLRRRLIRLIQKHRGSMSRLAAQKCAFAYPSARQNRFFAAALIENWCNHLLYNQALYSRSDLVPQVPLPSSQWDALSAQLPVWYNLTVNLCYPSTYKKQRTWPQSFSNQTEGQIIDPVRSFDGNTLNWAKKILLAQGANLHLLTKQKVNYLCIRYSPNSSAYNYWNEQMGLAAQRLAQTRQICTLSVTDILDASAVWSEAWQSITEWSSLHRTVRIISDLDNFKALLAAVPPSFCSSLDKRSRIFVIIDGTKDKIDNLSDLRFQAASILHIQPERVSWLWCQAENAAVIWSCPEGHFHLPIYYRITQDGHFCNPLAKNYPTLYSNLPIKFFDKCSCTCGA